MPRDDDWDWPKFTDEELIALMQRNDNPFSNVWRAFRLATARAENARSVKEMIRAQSEGVFLILQAVGIHVDPSLPTRTVGKSPALGCGYGDGDFVREVTWQEVTSDLYQLCVVCGRHSNHPEKCGNRYCPRNRRQNA